MADLATGIWNRTRIPIRTAARAALAMAEGQAMRIRTVVLLSSNPVEYTRSSRRGKGFISSLLGLGIGPARSVRVPSNRNVARGGRGACARIEAAYNVTVLVRELLEVPVAASVLYTQVEVVTGESGRNDVAWAEDQRDLGACRRNPATAMRRVPDARRRPMAAREAYSRTLSVRPRAPTKQMGRIDRSRSLSKRPSEEHVGVTAVRAPASPAQPGSAGGSEGAVEAPFDRSSRRGTGVGKGA